MNTQQLAAMRQALRKAFNLGSTYWQQADSEYTSQWKKADVTLASFNELVETTIAVIEQAEAAPVQKPVEHLIAAFRSLAPHCTMHDITRFREVCRNVLATPPAAQPAEWKGLTPADFDWLEQMFADKVSNNFVFADIVCVISAKLREKNGGQA